MLRQARDLIFYRSICMILRLVAANRVVNCSRKRKNCRILVVDVTFLLLLSIIGM